MKRFYSYGLFILFAISTTSCSLYQIDSRDTSSNFYPSKQSVSEVAYIPKAAQPYEVIGTIVVNVERTRGEGNQAEIIEKMKQEAAILGADAITNLATDVGSGKWAKRKPKKLFGNANVRVNLTTEAIVFPKPTEEQKLSSEPQTPPVY